MLTLTRCVRANDSIVKNIPHIEWCTLGRYQCDQMMEFEVAQFFTKVAQKGRHAVFTFYKYPQKTQ